MTAVIAGTVCLIYGLFPGPVTDFLFAHKYSSVAPYLFRYGLAMSFLAMAYLVMTYLLSLGKTRVAYPLLTVVLLEIGLISHFHSNIAQLVNVMLISGISSLLLVLLFYFKLKLEVRA